ncbi:E3 ubiquitin-protein ligase rnf213-alpha (Mysterin-A) (Mysterin-alpha) (RING finger protein 213-A) (RING finger protein 213-alpha) (RING-type E3 ubiquitin transferase rnf213-alpha) [Durusdinium trenchii]|uniref:E3 ubiquitin-protein ligase rnf213-alpha (Mysterin-A) (Mysterin-alpha) (RING finger protein 213-A) (RING finger protein 213-alpha) (RING-type E3 ubiquitin transferase rnf213-alpha) n=1 Tax=Durusdinium trenchii TaxID=1381693 RepID=A0ABP0S5W7_9DINO
MAYTPLVLVVNSSPALCHLFVPPHPGQPTGELERQRRDLSFLKLALCGLDLHATFCSMQSGQLQLKDGELGQLLMVFHPKSRAWSTRLWQWATGEDPKEVDLSMVREFLSSTIAQSPGLEGELGMAIYFALGRVIAIDDDLLSAVRWLESCVGGSLLSISTRIQLARRLLSSTPEVTLALEAVVEDESRRVGHRDHQVAAILLQACQEELESRGTSLNDLRCHLSGLVTTGLNFLWAMAAARMILVKAAETVRRQTPHLETSESAMELLQLDATPSRRAFEVFLAKQLNLDRIDLARLQRQSDTSELWRFLRFPAILDGLPPPSTLGHEICPSDCLLSMLGDEYSTLKDAILSPSTSSMTGRAGPVATVMAAFSTAFLSHFRRQHPMPAARELNLQHRELRTLLDAMLQNFPRSPGWQIHGNTTPEWVFMVRPIIHMAAMSQTDAEQSLWWRIFSSPQDLQRCLWPFMPEDEAAAALAALRENVKMYTCRCGFRYAVGECGQPMEQRRCPGCNQQIGGREHRPAAGNRRVDQVNQAAARPGFLDTRHEGDRQTCRGLNVDQLRCARYFLHGLLSLGCGTRSQSFGGLSAADLMERMKGDWQVLRTLHGWTPERLSERLHVLVLRGYCLSCPHSTLRRESLERDWSLFVGAAQSTAFTNMNRGRSPAEEKLAEELEESQTISCLASREREAMLPSLLRRWTPLDSLHMQEDLRSDPALMEKYQLVFEVVNSETDLFIASQLEPIVSFQNFLLGRFQGRWSKVEAQKLNVEQVLEEVPADRDQAAKLFAAAQKAWNLVAPQVDRFECQDIQIPQMSENPQEVPIMWWLRSESSDCPQSLKSLVLLRWLVDKHNAWLTHAARAPEMQHDAIQAPCCLTDALQPYFLHYEQGKVQLWAKEATQVHCTSKPERFDYAMVAGRVHELFMGARPVDRDRIEMYIFRSEGRAARPQFQTSLSEAGQELLLRLLSTGPQQDKCLQLLLQMEAWLRVAPRNDGMTAAEFARTKMHVAVAELPEALDALLVSQVSAAIECLEDASANPLESLHPDYRTEELSPAANAELAALSIADRRDLIQTLRQFLQTYLGDLQKPYPESTELVEFWRVEEYAWVPALARTGLKLSCFGPAYQELLRM